jgi:hypothetical protein
VQALKNTEAIVMAGEMKLYREFSDRVLGAWTNMKEKNP